MIWNTNGWFGAKPLTDKDDLDIHSAAFSGGGKKFVWGDKSGQIKVWRTDDWKLLKTLNASSSGSESRAIISVSFSKEGQLALLAIDCPPSKTVGNVAHSPSRRP